jgi:hypothetical protein
MSSKIKIPNAVYHGTNQDISTFEALSYFTVSFEQAVQYAKNQVDANGGTGLVYTVHTKMKNPKLLHDDLIEGLSYCDEHID